MRDALVRAHAARRTLVTAVCSCGWSGTIGATADCPACGAPERARLRPERAALLELMASSPAQALSRLHTAPNLRSALVQLGLIAAHGERAKPGGNGRRRPPGRSYTMTERGSLALAAYRAMKAVQRERAAIAGMTAARHADLLPDPPRRISPTSPCPSHPRLMAGECLTCEGNGTWIPKAVAR